MKNTPEISDVLSQKEKKGKKWRSCVLHLEKFVVQCILTEKKKFFKKREFFALKKLKLFLSE